MTYIILFSLVLISLSFHEFAHAYAAYRLGDTTAKDQGRMTVNPLKHIDTFGTILLPMILLMGSAASGGLVPVFGYAKPVPVNYHRFRHPTWGFAWVAAAGPLANLCLAFFAGLFIDVHNPQGSYIWTIFFLMNVLLALFNMLPVPPLDGSRIMSALLPEEWRQRYNSMGWVGFILLLIVIRSHWFDQVFFRVSGLLLGIIQSIKG